MPDKWIYGFRRTGKRELSEEERETLKRLGTRKGISRYIRGALSVVVFFVGLSGIAFASGGARWGWPLLIAGTIAFFWSLNWANKAERYALLCRRAARVGVVDQFVREEVSEAVRNAYSKPQYEDGETVLGQAFWEAEEQFEERLIKLTGKRPVVIETPEDDDVLLTCDGKLVPDAIDLPAVTV